MLPKSAIITSYLAKEYQLLLPGAILVRTEYRKDNKLFRFSFIGENKTRIEYSFAPPHFALLDGWARRDDAFEVWQGCAGSKVTCVAGSMTNRLVSFSLTKEENEPVPREFQIVFELFGALTNAYLLSENQEILHATRIINDRRRLRPAMKYVAPTELDLAPPAGETEIARTAACQYWLTYDRADYRVVSKPANGEIAGEVSQDRQEGIPDDALSGILDGASIEETPALKDDDPTPLVSLFQLLDQIVVVKDEFAALRDRLLRRLQRDVQRQQATLGQLQSDLQEAESGEKLKQWGDILMANPHAPAYESKVSLFDFYHEQEIEIPLVSGKTVIESATVYYKKAKKLQRVPALLAPRMEKLRALLAGLQVQLDLVGQAANLAQLNEIIAKHGIDTGDRQQIAEAKAAETSADYRSFRSSAGEKILVGKSAAGNEVLTFKVARTYDRWFHTQQANGSHVVLVMTDKNRAPSRRSIIEAAQIAAYYSDMRKSRNVPVIYTECRHVRKAGGGAVGKVIYQKVTSIFVDPRLPSGKPESDVDMN
jgi:predicted ribosome quality control (RQC) complex YloA/Tae2 family protein